MTLNTSTRPTELGCDHVCQSHMLACARRGLRILSTCSQPRPDAFLVSYLGRQIMPPPPSLLEKLGQFTIFNATGEKGRGLWVRRRLLCGHVDGRRRPTTGKGAESCRTERIMKTKQQQTIMKFEDTSAETRWLSKWSCCAGSVAARSQFSDFFFLSYPKGRGKGLKRTY